VCIVRSNAAPRQPIDAASAARGRAFLFERGDGSGWGDTVQRHVHQEGVAASGGRTRRGLKAFPVGAAGIVDVDVGIHQPRKDGSIAEIVGFGSRRNVRRFDDVPNPLAFHEQSCGTHSLRSHDSARKESVHDVNGVLSSSSIRMQHERSWPGLVFQLSAGFQTKTATGS
jgi:hypothetical protein